MILHDHASYRMISYPAWPDLKFSIGVLGGAACSRGRGGTMGGVIPYEWYASDCKSGSFLVTDYQIHAEMPQYVHPEVLRRK